MLRRTAIIALTFAATALSASAVSAGSRSSVYLVLPLSEVRSITVSTPSVSLPMVGNTGTGEPVSGGSVVYSTPGSSDKISVSINSAMPSGVTLTVSASDLQQDPGCTESIGSPAGDGPVALTTSATPLIEFIGPFVDPDQACEATAVLDYQITTDGALGGSGTRTVTFTISA